jgi:hypothetical protein
MVAEFRNLGVAFQYPENWSLDEEDALAGGRSVTVFSPGGGFWSVSIHPPGIDLDELAKAAVCAIQEEYKEVEAEEIQQTLFGRKMNGYDLNFYYLDLTNTAKVRCLQTDDATYSIFYQAEDREFDQIQIVMLAITKSFLDNLPQHRSGR